jgi:DNA-binding beta-propeller fold protein YncE
MNYKVQIFDGNGRFISRFGTQGDGSGDFGRPKGIAVDQDGNIYLADALFDTVQIFDREGNYMLNFGSVGNARGAFWMPSGLFIDSGGQIYVADSYNRRIQIFEHLGEGENKVLLLWIVVQRVGKQA